MARIINGVTQKIVLIIQAPNTTMPCRLFSVFFSKVRCFLCGLRRHFSPNSAKLSERFGNSNAVAEVKAMK